MDIMCLMGLFPREYEAEVVRDSITGMQNAANKLQWAIVRGLDSANVRVRICNSLYIGSYPRRYRKVRIPSFSFAHCDGADDRNIGFVNLPVIKQASRFMGIRKNLVKWAAEKTDRQKVLLVYAMTTPFVQAASYIQRRYPQIKVCMVVPDLPEYMNVGAMQKGGLYTKIKTLEIRWLKRCARDIRYYVLLTDAMKTWFNHDITYTVVEGIAPEDSADGTPAVRERSIVYAGGIKREYGVLDLAEAFAEIDMPEWKLVIYGDGADMDALREISAQDSRILLMGMQPNAVVIEHQRRASLLVNPRKNQEFAKYSFPSKVLEYMASGTPMLAYKLDGIPGEYDLHYYRIPDEDGGMTAALKRVMELSDEERIQVGERAREFVRQHKNSRVQGEKILGLLSGD